MPTVRRPRRGSLQFYPRNRAKNETPRIRHLVKQPEGKVSCFAGYKVGMVQVIMKDTRKNSPTFGLDVAKPATLVECPPVKIFSIRYYKNTNYGLKLVTENLNPKLDKELARRVTLPKKAAAVEPGKIEKKFDEIRAMVYTMPKLTTIEKKKPALFEVIFGGTVEQQLNFLKENMDKELNVKNFFKPGELVDVRAVTKGKGYSGVVKRFGVALRHHKSEKKVRAAVLAAEGDAQVKYFAPMSNKHGYYLRTEYNKLILKIIDDVKSMKHVKHYGELNTTCLVLKGTVPGPAKRLIKIVPPIRPNKKLTYPQTPEARIVE